MRKAERRCQIWGVARIMGGSEVVMTQSPARVNDECDRHIRDSDEEFLLEYVF
jgi:hypothetical protein